jgi:hypothetical protein
MEDFICKILLVASVKQINMAMFADDLTVRKTGNDIPQMPHDISNFINNTVNPWAVSHNMILKESKCHSFLFSQWYHMSTTNVTKLQRLQNQGLHIALGVPQRTHIDSQHFEAALSSLQVCYDLATAYQAEKFCHHHPDDPIYRTAHQALPPTRLKHSNWQYKSDQILEMTVSIQPNLMFTDHAHQIFDHLVISN